jgi:hypothetical protein
MRKLVAVAAGIVAAAEDYKRVVDVAVSGNQCWDSLNFERTRCRS